MAERFDVLVVGSGPGGSVAALVLARGGARVALVDRSSFPRDKACGDLVGPRGVRLLADLGVQVAGERVGDMVVVGPTGRRVVLPCLPGRTYPGWGLAVPRMSLDATLRRAAVAAGAVPFVGRAAEPLRRGDSEGDLDGFVLSDSTRLRADVVIGADGALSRVAEVADLVEPRRALWGFALRGYAEGHVDLPTIVFWEPSPWRAFPGYGWVFPGPGGRVNLGLGLGGVGRGAGGGPCGQGGSAQAVRQLDAFVHHLRSLGLVRGLGSGTPPTARLGGWLKMGMVGTTPARGRVLLVGDAAGLVNPLQGEGISTAMGSGRAAAEAVLARPEEPGASYRASLASTYAPYQSVAAPIHTGLLLRPRWVSAAGRVLTAPVLGRALAGGWSLFWNDLLDGAQPGSARTVAEAATWTARLAAAGSRTTRRHRPTAAGVHP